MVVVVAVGVVVFPTSCRALGAETLIQTLACSVLSRLAFNRLCAAPIVTEGGRFEGIVAVRCSSIVSVTQRVLRKCCEVFRMVRVRGQRCENVSIGGGRGEVL